MPYWIKTITIADYTYGYEQEAHNYTVTSYEGPFRTINDVEEYIRDTKMDDVEVLELG